MRERFAEMLNDAQRINSERNRLLHSEYWPVTDNDEILLILSRRLRDATKPNQYHTAHELFKHADSTTQCIKI